jgi:type II secretion system protein J
MIEVLLAIGIFSLVMIAIYSCWSAILRGTRVGLAAAAEVQRTRVAIHALEESLGSAVMYADNPMYYSFYADTGRNFAYLSFVARLPDSFPGSGLFPGQALRRVTFQVDDQGALKLSQSTLLDVSEQPYTITLAPKVSVFAVEFYNPRRNEWLPEWISTNQLPMMVRVAVNFGEGRDASQGVTIRSIPLQAAAITRVGGGPNVPGARGPGSTGGGLGGAYDGPLWNPRLPPDFGANQGNAMRNPIFPPSMSP